LKHQQQLLLLELLLLSWGSSPASGARLELTQQMALLLLLLAPWAWRLPFLQERAAVPAEV
jgi:hypothetical protein